MNISPISIWVNGSNQTASQFLLNCIFDNLSNEAQFYYQLQDASSIKLVDGNLVMSGADYQNWNDNPDINLAAYQWAALQLSITLI